MLGAAALFVTACGCVGSVERGPDAAMHGDPDRPAQARWLRTELYVAVGRADDPAGPRIDEATWRAFLDGEVTPRFPDGFSVYDAYGQWRHPDSAEARDRIEAVRGAFKSRFGHDSVLRATGAVDLSF
jgi:hypothetical protein